MLCPNHDCFLAKIKKNSLAFGSSKVSKTKIRAVQTTICVSYLLCFIYRIICYLFKCFSWCPAMWWCVIMYWINQETWILSCDCLLADRSLTEIQNPTNYIYLHTQNSFIQLVTRSIFSSFVHMILLKHFSLFTINSFSWFIWMYSI
jgi:hypothetical protein